MSSTSEYTIESTLMPYINSSRTEQSEKLLPSDITYYSVAVILTLLSFVGVIMNTLNVITFRKFDSLRTSTNIMVEALTWCDLVMAGIGNPMVAVSAGHRRWIFGHQVAVVYGFSATLMGLFSIHLLTAISIDRYIAIVHPILKVTMKKNTALKQVVVCFCLAFFWSLMPLLGWNYYTLEGLDVSASVNWVVHNNSERAYICLLFLFCFVLPITVITISYFIIVFVIRNISRRLREHSSELPQKRNDRMLEIRLARTMFYVICSFMISWTPYAIIALVTAFGGPQMKGHIIGTLPAIMAKTAVVWNPITYAFTNRQFKVCLKSLLTRKTSPDANRPSPTTGGHSETSVDMGQNPLLPMKDRTSITTRSTLPTSTPPLWTKKPDEGVINVSGSTSQIKRTPDLSRYRRPDSPTIYLEDLKSIDEIAESEIPVASSSNDNQHPSVEATM